MPTIYPSDSKIIHIFESDGSKIEFPQRKAVVNFGTSSVETFGLINCIAIGGIFVDKDGEVKGAFMAHESPADIMTELYNLDRINQEIQSRGYHISKMLLFKIEPEGASSTIYTFLGNSYNYDALCEKIAEQCERRFGVKPIIVEYGYYCGRYMKNRNDPRLSLCGKATIDPTKDYTTTYSGNIRFGGRRKSKLRRWK